MIRTIFIFSICIAVSQQNLATKGCGPWCVKCSSEGICQACQNYKLLNGKCDTSKPAPENCEIEGIYESGEIECMYCKQGYALQLRYKGNVTCEKGIIPGCFNEMIFWDNKCYACPEGTPAANKLSCKAGIAPFCLVGTGTPDDKRCLVCKDGYNEYKDQCIVSQVKGCRTASTYYPFICNFCDYTKGYYAMQDDKSCQKMNF